MDFNFKNTYKTVTTAFTRCRKFNFQSIFILIIQKSTKSLQIKLNEFMLHLPNQNFNTITNSAFCQARKKISAYAFKELSEDILTFIYRDGDHKTFKGFELIAGDASDIRLPDSLDIQEHFGKIPYTASNSSKGSTKDYYCGSQLMCLYDCLNHTALAAELNNPNIYEVTALQKLLLQNDKGIKVVKNPLYVLDRGLQGYDSFSWLQGHNISFVIRLSSMVFKQARKFFDKDCSTHDEWLTVKRTSTSKSNERKRLKENEERNEGKDSFSNEMLENFSIADTLTLRFVRIILDDGTIEVLATNVKEDQISYEDFKELYHLRWKIETFFLFLKERFCLENFTGISIQAVLQDFWSTIFLSNLESFLSQSAQEILDQKTVKNSQKVNRAVSFNAIKNEAFDLFLENISTDKLLEKLTELFLTNPTQHRKNRSRDRDNNIRKSYNHHRYKKKNVF